MTRSSSLLVGIVLCLAACKSKPDSETKDKDNAPASTGSAAPSTAAPTSTDDSDDSDDKLQRACHDYQTILAKLAKCDAYPANQREALQRGFDGMTKSWATAEPAAKKALSQACESGVEQVKTSATEICGW